MVPIVYIRKKVLNLKQSELAVIAGVSQATVSRWELGVFEPNRDELARIRNHVMGKGLPWNDSWFFDVPVIPAA